MKGRARLLLSDGLLQAMKVPIEKPTAGTVYWGQMEVKELFDTFSTALLLSEGYAIIGIFFDITLYSWILIIESADLPLPEEGRTLPFIMPRYQWTEEGKITLKDMHILN